MTYRLVVGESRYSKNTTSLDGCYFDVVGFIPFDISNCTNKTTFVRVLGFLFGKEKAKEKYDKWIESAFDGVSVAEELKEEKIFLGNIEEEKNIENFLRMIDKSKVDLKVLLLGDSAIKHEETFKKYDVYKFTHPSPTGNSKQLFKKIDLMYDKNYEDIERIIEGFQVKS